LTVAGGFFVVHLDLLPERLEIVGEHVIPVGQGTFRASGLALTEDRRTLFLGSDGPGRVLSFDYDPRTHRLSEPRQILETENGVVSRLRLHEPSGRLYAAARGGQVYELDVRDPRRLRLSSVWQAPGYDGPMQDVNWVEIDGVLTILAVKNNEGFALLVPDAQED
jgi:hypothetical protein